MMKLGRKVDSRFWFGASQFFTLIIVFLLALRSSGNLAMAAALSLFCWLGVLATYALGTAVKERPDIKLRDLLNGLFWP